MFLCFNPGNLQTTYTVKKSVHLWLLIDNLWFVTAKSISRYIRTEFHYNLIWLKFNPKYFIQNYTYCRQIFQGWSPLIRINTDFKSLIMRPNLEFIAVIVSPVNDKCCGWSALIRINTDRKSLIMRTQPRVHCRHSFNSKWQMLFSLSLVAHLLYTY